MAGQWLAPGSSAQPGPGSPACPALHGLLRTTLPSLARTALLMTTALGPGLLLRESLATHSLHALGSRPFCTCTSNPPSPHEAQHCPPSPSQPGTRVSCASTALVLHNPACAPPALVPCPRPPFTKSFCYSLSSPPHTCCRRHLTSDWWKGWRSESTSRPRSWGQYSNTRNTESNLGPAATEQAEAPS
jgi:hypothetical protein